MPRWLRTRIVGLFENLKLLLRDGRSRPLTRIIEFCNKGMFT